MRGNRQAGGVSLVDHTPQLLQDELAEQHLRARGREPAAGHDLNDVDAALGAFLHGAP